MTLQRFVEFIWDRQNTQRLRAAGGIEFGGLHYPAMILVHASWLAGFVAGELTLVPLALDLPIYSLVFLSLYAGAAYLRIQVESSALTWAPGERSGDQIQYRK